jgi:hypothetical protein
MANADQQEMGSSLLVIGWLMLLFALAVIFFHSAAGGIGRRTIDTIAITLLVGGIACNGIGYRIRGKAH